MMPLGLTLTPTPTLTLTLTVTLTLTLTLTPTLTLTLIVRGMPRASWKGYALGGQVYYNLRTTGQGYTKVSMMVSTGDCGQVYYNPRVSASLTAILCTTLLIGSISSSSGYLLPRLYEYHGMPTLIVYRRPGL